MSFNFNLNDGTPNVFYNNSGKMSVCTLSEWLRYLCGTYTNYERFMSRYLKPRLTKFIEVIDGLAEDVPNKKEMYESGMHYFNFLQENYADARPFSYAEAFNIESNEFKALVFGSINITEMISNLGKKQIKVAGINVKHKTFNENGDFLGYEENNNIYETYEVSGEKLGISNSLYVVKCWCTTTNKEHWLWIEEAYKEDPLSAIASTFRIHANLIPHIKELKRQGDVLIVEMKEEVTPTGEIVPLTKEQYFDLLTAQS